MQDNTKKISTEEAMVHASMMGVNNSLTPNAVQARIQELMLEKMELEASQDKTRKAIRKRQQESIAKESARVREQELLQQAGCSHRKQNGTAATVGMYSHQNKVMVVCQNCFKEWINEPAPNELIPSHESMGGPGVR